jgi:hypothetical protein
VCCVQVGSGVQWGMSELPVDYTFWLEQGMDPTHANFLHHTCKSAVGPTVTMLQHAGTQEELTWAWCCWTAPWISLCVLSKRLGHGACMCVGPAVTLVHMHKHLVTCWCCGCCMVVVVAAPGGFPMSEALPMPGNMVSPNTITLKEGYTWEVRHIQALTYWAMAGNHHCKQTHAYLLQWCTSHLPGVPCIRTPPPFLMRHHLSCFHTTGECCSVDFSLDPWPVKKALGPSQPGSEYT